MEFAKVLLSLASLVVSVIALTVALRARRDARKAFNAKYVPKLDFAIVNGKCDREDYIRHLHLRCTNKSNVDAHNLNVILNIALNDAEVNCINKIYKQALWTTESHLEFCLWGKLSGPSAQIAPGAFELVSLPYEQQALKLSLGEANPSLQLRGRFKWDSPAVGVASSVTERFWNLKAVLSPEGFVESWSASTT